MTPPRAHAAVWPRRLPAALVVPDTPLWFNLEVSARRYPDKPASLFFGRPMSYRELHGQALALAGWLQAQGVQRGDRVLICLQNCPQLLVAFYAVQRADAVVVPVNPMNRADELAHFITDAQARAAITSTDLAATLAAANAQLPAEQRLRHMLVARLADALPAEFAAEEEPPPWLRAWLHDGLCAGHPLPAGAARWADALAAGHAPGPALAEAGDLALLPYTSGTTGQPKGCRHTHRTLMHNAVGGGLWGQVSAEAISLAVVPMFHITGLMYGVIGSVYAGSTVVILPRWDRELAARVIALHGVTHWVCVPTMIVDLLASPHCAGFDLGSLRLLSGGGAAMPQAVAERLLEEFGLRFVEGYGLTETAAPTHSNPPDRPKLQCLGIPIFGVDSRVVDAETLLELPPGEVGEIVTHGPMVFEGYWGQPEATRAAFVEIDGKRFFRTGDLGRRDDEGYFFMTDRLKRMINASGFKVWPGEVELLLFKCPWVQEACVVAKPDAHRGETVKALVVLREEARGRVTEQQVVDWAHAHMAVYKAPRVVAFVDALPKTASGKVMWRLLQERETAAAH